MITPQERDGGVQGGGHVSIEYLLITDLLRTCRNMSTLFIFIAMSAHISAQLNSPYFFLMLS